MTLSFIFKQAPFVPKVRLSFEKGRYLVRTIENASELKRVRQLRYEVFFREGLKRKNPFGQDIDPFDLKADHLVVIEKKSHRFVGCYRFISSRFSNQFYSQTEFDISSFLKIEGNKLEMSRACIHKDFRNGQVMHLLWRGLMEYVRNVDARYLFGCSSVKTVAPEKIQQISQFLTEKGHSDPEMGVQPLIPPSALSGIEARAVSSEEDSALPPLFQSYLKAGARVAPKPYLDKEFQCVDFFTVLDLKKVTPNYERRYRSEAVAC